MVGTGRVSIRRAVQRLLDDPGERSRMASVGRRVYGDGSASRRIADVLLATSGARGGETTKRSAVR